MSIILTTFVIVHFINPSMTKFYATKHFGYSMYLLKGQRNNTKTRIFGIKRLD